jgi:hypothetical protein
MGLIMSYSLLVPIWVFTVYLFSAPPMLAATFLGAAVEARAAWRAVRDRAAARRMIKARRPAPATPASAGGGGGAGDAGAGRGVRPQSPAAAGGNPTGSAGRRWLTKLELLALYQRRGLADSDAPPAAAGGVGGGGGVGGFGVLAGGVVGGGEAVPPVVAAAAGGDVAGVTDPAALSAGAPYPPPAPPPAAPPAAPGPPLERAVRAGAPGVG